MKKIMQSMFKLLLCTLLFIWGNTSLSYAIADLPEVYSEGAILIDGETGQILYSKNEHLKYEPASTTKVMTALIVLENKKLTDKVTIGLNPPLVDGTAIGISEGEIYTVEELLLGLLLESGNDCAEALAEFVAGSNEGFAILMNEKAKSLGALDTTFKNPSGLHEDGHLTTAYDLSLIMKAASHNSDYVRIAQVQSYKYVNHPFSDGSEKWAVNRNQLFNETTHYIYSYAYCGKNGYTPEANHAYTGTAVKDGQMLIGAFLNATDKDNFYLNIGPLFTYGFENFETVKLISKGDTLSIYKIANDIEIPLISSRDIYYTKERGISTSSYKINYDESSYNGDDITKGNVLFKASVDIDNQPIAYVDLISSKDAKLNVLSSFKESSLFYLIKIVVISLLVIFIIIFMAKGLLNSLRIKKIRRRNPSYKKR
ncbi:D-alanyl-D-alanine carboxypeptidase family protein [Clostridium sp.]|uniref:D-alanyl-D-alanine carboxypeptidase family protein n=1 Tax=Clostridium sp. TaxID=1506 RepID=UPI002620991F|nr:D-alanyl-D-alanine carboxypeptidase family protein [Clostridium sp.]